MVTRMTTPTKRVLRFLLSVDRAYGLEIIEELAIGAGTLYPMLTRLETVGWVDSRWEDIDPSATGRPARRYYALTSTGRVEASARLDAGTIAPDTGLAEA